MTSGAAKVPTQSPQSLEDSGWANISIAVTLTLDPLKPFRGFSRGGTHLYWTISGHQIVLSGGEAQEEIGSKHYLSLARGLELGHLCSSWPL